MHHLALMCIYVLWYTSQLFGCVSVCLRVLSFSSPCRTSYTFIGQDEKCHKISSLYFVFLVQYVALCHAYSLQLKPGT